MIIRLAYSFDLGAYKSLFPDIELFDWKKDRNEEIDLMVFPGGEDVSMEYYASSMEAQAYRYLTHSDRERDDYEMDILDACYDKRLKVNKILGVCRGMQLINVRCDGKLYYDTAMQIGYHHENVHQIVHKTASALGFIKDVNSLHHQGLRTMGQYNPIGNRSNPVIIASDKQGYIPEIAVWDNDRILGVQFHPEYFWNENPDKQKFRDVVYAWIEGRTKILGAQKGEI